MVGDEHVPYGKADAAGGDPRHGNGNVHDPRTAPGGGADLAHHLLEGHRLGPDGIDREVLGRLRGLDADIRDIAGVDRADPVATIARDREDRQAPQQPGDVVHQDVAATEDDGRANHRMGQAALGERLLDECLASEVGEARVERGLRDAQVDDAPDSGLTRRAEQRLRVLDRSIEADVAPVEADPVGVVDGRDAFQAAGERIGVVERIGSNIDPTGDRARSVGVTGEGPHPAPIVEEVSGDSAPRVAECPRHDIETGVRHAMTIARRTGQVLLIRRKGTGPDVHLA